MATSTRSKQSPKVEQFLATLRAHIPKLQDEYHVRNLWIFGSYVRGEMRKKSDLDVLVEFEKAPSLLKFVHLENELNDLLGVKVDLVMKSALKPAIGKRILEEIVPV